MLPRDVACQLTQAGIDRIAGLREMLGAYVNGTDAAFTKGWREVFSLQRGFAARENTGMPGPKAVARELARWRKALR